MAMIICDYDTNKTRILDFLFISFARVSHEVNYGLFTTSFTRFLLPLTVTHAKQKFTFFTFMGLRFFFSSIYTSLISFQYYHCNFLSHQRHLFLLLRLLRLL